MALGPEDVIRRTFRSTRFGRGYDEEEVDDFRQDVVAELRRLHDKVDELEAARVRPLSLQQLDEDQESERVAREQEQLELVRIERRELVGDLTELQARMDRAEADIAQADAKVAAAAEAAAEAETRRAATAAAEAETARRLQQLSHEHDVLRGAHETLVQELRTIRLAAEERAVELLGADEVTAVLEVTSDSDDFASITALASRLHGHYIEQGRLEGERLREEAKAAAQQLREEAEAASAEATESVQRLLATARQQSRALIGEAEVEHDRLVGTAQAEHDRLVETGQAEHDRLVTEAEDERAGILADLQVRRELLERRVAELDRQQDEYRGRLRELMQRQLTSLNDDGWRVGLNGTSGSGENARR